MTIANKNKESKQELLNELAREIHPAGLRRNVSPFREQLHGVDLRILKTKGCKVWVIHTGDQELIECADIASCFGNVYLSACSDIGTNDLKEIERIAFLSAESMDGELREKKWDTDFVIDSKDVAPVRFLNEPGWCWKRLPFDPDINGDRTIWETELFPRFKSNLQVFLAWVGSLFDYESQREKYIWMYGGGESGKSTICDFLIEIFGSAAGVRRPDSFDSPFFMSGLVGNRLTVMPEATSKLITGGKWKSVTGDDYHEIEKKYQNAFVSRIYTKFIVASNEYPNIPTGHEHRRRIILVETERPKGWKQVRTKQQTMDLLAEGCPYFFALCKEAYENDKMLSGVDYSAVDEIQEDDWKVVASEKFVRDEYSSITNTQFTNTADVDSYKLRVLAKYLKKEWGITAYRTHAGRGYKGLRLKK